MLLGRLNNIILPQRDIKFNCGTGNEGDTFQKKYNNLI